jgi:hypothetical protein
MTGHILEDRGSVIGKDKGSSVSRVTELRAGQLQFDSRKKQGIFLFVTASRSALGPTKPPIQWVQVGLSPVLLRPGREADHSHPISASSCHGV